MIECTQSVEEKMLYITRQYGRNQYLLGLERGLRVAEQIAGWLAEQHETGNLPQWVEAAIRQAREEAQRGN